MKGRDIITAVINEDGLDTDYELIPMQDISGTKINRNDLTMADLYAIYLQNYAEVNMKPTSLTELKSTFNNHILPELGDRKVISISPVDISSFYAKLTKGTGSEKGYSAGSVKRWHNDLRSLFAQAVNWGIIRDNPCSKVKVKNTSTAIEDNMFFTPEQTKRFLQFVDEGFEYDCGSSRRAKSYTRKRQIPFQTRLLYHMCIYVGARRGELVGLKWRDIDFEKNTVYIRRQTTMANGKPYTCEPKTHSKRYVAISGSVAEMAAEWKKWQEEHVPGWNEDCFVFINEKTYGQMYPTAPYKMFKRHIKQFNACAEEGKQLPDISLHGLRHTNATLMISQNVDIKCVSQRLGHARASTTLDIYAHSLESGNRDAAAKLETLLCS